MTLPKSGAPCRAYRTRGSLANPHRARIHPMQSEPDGRTAANLPAQGNITETHRWSMVGLAYPPTSPPTTSDLLALALMPPGSEDPVEGIVDAVRIELLAFASVAQGPLRDLLTALGARLQAAITLLRRTDHREAMPPEDPCDDAAPPPPADGSTLRAPASPSPADDDDPERTHDALPG